MKKTKKIHLVAHWTRNFTETSSELW